MTGDRQKRTPTFAARRARHLALGKRGERLAARLLRELDIEILVRNYRAARGEIDLVARDGALLCFVEVKTRRRAVRSRPADAVGAAKRRSVIRAAHQYLREIGSPPVAYRYDIVEVILGGRGTLLMYYWPSAFNEQTEALSARFPSLVGLLEDD